jgi:hypothetical protein
MIHSIQAIWFGSDWWGDSFGGTAVWKATRGIRDAIELVVWDSTVRFDDIESADHCAQRSN